MRCATDSLLAATLALCLVGCISVPQRYRSPLHRYEPQHTRASVHGFERTEFFPTSVGSGALVAPQLGIHAAAGAAKGEYREVSDAYLMRWFLEDTQCIEVIDEGGTSPLRVEGTAGSTARYGALGFVSGAFIVVTLTGLLGVPYTKYAQREAVVRIYDNRRFLYSVTSTESLRYGTTAYTDDRDDNRAIALARGMALRSAADKAAAFLCSR